MLQFVCDVVKDTGEEEYLRPFIYIGLDWFAAVFPSVGRYRSIAAACARSTACSGKCGQCHVVSVRRKLNTQNCCFQFNTELFACIDRLRVAVAACSGIHSAVCIGTFARRTYRSMQPSVL